MSITGVEVSALDHVHLYVADPKAAAAWYERVLGLQVMPSSGDGTASSKRPLYMATPKGQYCASIFVGKPPSDGDHTTAFRVSGRVFIAFGEALETIGVASRKGPPLTTLEADDHGLAFSYYFSDPDGNHLELTTYDHPKVRAWLAALKAEAMA
jgi:catechol 2,3-dioxygenase-like lactoylglutathione lyase family enzyme